MYCDILHCNFGRQDVIQILCVRGHLERSRLHKLIKIIYCVSYCVSVIYDKNRLFSKQFAKFHM